MTTTHIQLAVLAVVLGVLMLAAVVTLLARARADRRAARRRLAKARAAYARTVAATHNQKDNR